MRRNLFAAGLLFAALAAPHAADAQVSLPVSLGLSGGAAFPTGELGRDDAFDTGWGFEVNATLDVARGLGVYAAYDRYAFPFERDIFFGFDQEQGDLIDQGLAGGVILSVPAGSSGFRPWIRGGAIYNSVQFDFDNVEDDPESDSQLGFEVGAGLGLPLGSIVTMSPSVRYRSYEPEIAEGNDFDLSYVVGELGLTFHF